MKNNDGRQEYGIFLNNTQLRASANESRNMLRGIGDTAIAESARIDNAYQKVAGAAVALFSTAAIKQFGMELINITGQFQTFEAVLTNTLQSPAKAKQSMMMLQEFAATTPFQVDALTGAFVKLANQGFIPTYAQMMKLGNLASSTGKGFDQLAEAVIDAQTGEFERLKEFGIRASKEGEKVTFTFKEQKTQIDFTASSIRDYVLSLGELKGVAGANAEIAKTLTGQYSNLQDTITQTMNKIGQSSEGMLSGAISGTAYLVEHYEEIGRVLGVLIASYGTYKAAVIAYAVAQKLAVSAGNIKAFFDLAKGIKTVKDAQIALNLAMGANPFIKLASILMTVGGLIWAFARNSEDATKGFGEFALKIKQEEDTFEDLKSAIKNTAEGTKERADVIKLINQRYPDYLSSLLTEKSRTDEIISSLTTANEKMVENIKLKLKQSQLEGILSKQLEVEVDFADKLIAGYSKTDKTSAQIALFTQQIAAITEKAREGKATIEDARSILISLGEDEYLVNNAIKSTDTGTARRLRDIFGQFVDIKKAADEAGNSKQVLDELLKTDTISGTGPIKPLPAGINPKTSDQVKKNEARIEAERKLKEALVNMQFDTEQARIEAMADGLDKELAQIELNYTKKQTAIELWEREQRQIVVDAQKTTFIAQGGKEQDFKVDGSDPAFAPINKSYDAKTAANNAEQTASNEKLLTDLKAQWQTWGDDYQQIEDQITATRANADRDRRSINEAHKAGKIDNTEAMTATRKVDSGEQKQIANLESQKTKLSSSWEQVFRDLQGMSRSQVKILISEINDQLSNSELSPADHSALLEQLDKAKDYATTLNPFASFVDGINDVKTATELLGKAKQALEATKTTDTPEKEKKAAEQAVKEAEKALADTKKERNEAASKSLGDISGMASATSDLLKTFGVESPAVDGVVGALGSLASIDFTNPMSIITGGLGAIANLLGGIFGEVDKRKEQQIADIQRTVDSITESYDKLDKAIGKAYSNDAADLIGDEIKMREQQRGLIEQQKKIEESRKNPDDGALEGYDKAIDDINLKIEESKEAACDAIFGSDVQSAIDEFASAYMNSWASGEDRAQSQKDVVKNMLRGIIKEMLKADIKGSVEKMRKQIEGFMSDDVLSELELSQIDKMGDEIGHIMEERGKIYDKILKDDKPIDKDETSLSGQIRGTVATEQSVSELGGIFRGMADTGRRIEIGLDLGFKTVAEMARTQLLIEANTRRSADNTDGLTSKIDATNTKLDTLISKIKPDNGSY